MLLFYEAITRATRRLYLSYPAWDDAAQPLLPSPYLMEVEQAFGGTKILRTETTDFSPLPAGDQPLSAAEFRVQAMADALSGDTSLLAGLMQIDCESDSGSRTNCRTDSRTELHSVQDGLQIRPTKNISAGLELIILRQDRERFGPAEGLLPGKAVEKLLAAELLPQRSFTASELEKYASCPYRFLLENVLQLLPPEDLTLELDVLERGQIVHEVLALFHRRVNEALGRPGSPLELEPAEFERLLQNALEEMLPPPSSNPLRTALREVDRRLITRWLSGYRDQHQKYDNLWKTFASPPVPEFFEASFGKSKHGKGSLSIDDPLKFPTGEDTVRISGRIDRIDTGKIGRQIVFNVVDYKTGSSVKVTKENVERGIALQLPLYCLATAELLLNNRDALPWQAGYWHVKKEGFKAKQVLKTYQITPNGIEPTAEWEEIRAILGKTVAGLVRGIRQGCFPVFNPDRRCTGYCPFRTVCRIGQIRALEKKWSPTFP